jgi:small ubiquitin-related modifier
VFFRIKRSTQLKKLMNAYCDRQSVDMNAIAFLFDGRRLRAEQTPDEVCAIIFLQIPELKTLHYNRESL